MKISSYTSNTKEGMKIHQMHKDDRFTEFGSLYLGDNLLRFLSSVHSWSARYINDGYVQKLSRFF